jgi:hypothetical protein
MELMKGVHSFEINGKCEKKYILSLLIDDESSSLI